MGAGKPVGVSDNGGLQGKVVGSSVIGKPVVRDIGELEGPGEGIWAIGESVEGVSDIGALLLASVLGATVEPDVGICVVGEPVIGVSDAGELLVGLALGICDVGKTVGLCVAGKPDVGI